MSFVYISIDCSTSIYLRSLSLRVFVLNHFFEINKFCVYVSIVTPFSAILFSMYLIFSLQRFQHQWLSAIGVINKPLIHGSFILLLKFFMSSSFLRILKNAIYIFKIQLRISHVFQCKIKKNKNQVPYLIFFEKILILFNHS